jgi:hypothetical protein
MSRCGAKLFQLGTSVSPRVSRAFFTAKLKDFLSDNTVMTAFELCSSSPVSFSVTPDKFRA